METIYCYRMGPAVYRILCPRCLPCNAVWKTRKKQRMHGAKKLFSHRASFFCRNALYKVKGSESMPQDKALVHGLRKGSEACAQALVQQHYGEVLRYARHLCRNETLAEDITQEAFLRVLEKVMRGQVAGNLRAYCFVTARHLYLDSLRRPSQQALEEMAAAEDELTGAESDNAFRQMVAGLPADVREAVILRFAYRLKFKEIAVVQGVAARTAQARVRRGIQWLKANWREDM